LLSDSGKWQPQESRQVPLLGALFGDSSMATTAARPMSAEEKKVIFASSLGTVFEWYDF
jgi:hypothetical protein